ncbi:hypothetical protein [Rappaport israeli]|uniref:hypothetical protein n=1 Tax=Rappaport israeli TaxID=1839807 RepID=UPI000930A0F6|nr:hypothetical protein [Rappaport israeli]
MIDERTPHNNLPLPNQQNLLSEDVERIRTAIGGIDEALHSAQQTLTDALTEAAQEREQALETFSDTIAKKQRKTYILALAGL